MQAPGTASSTPPVVKLDAGLVALVHSGDVGLRGGAQGSVGRGRGHTLAAAPDVARVVTFYDTRDPGMVAARQTAAPRTCRLLQAARGQADSQ